MFSGYKLLVMGDEFQCFAVQNMPIVNNTASDT